MNDVKGPRSNVAPTFQVREATIADIRVLAQHRAAMFRDMGRLAPDGEAPLVRATTDYFRGECR